MLKPALILAAITLTACGSATRIPNAAAGTTVNIQGKAILVTQDKGMWYAVHSDYWANNMVVLEEEFLPRKLAFIQAIETVSKCKVIDSVPSFGTASLQASVKC